MIDLINCGYWKYSQFKKSSSYNSSILPYVDYVSQIPYLRVLTFIPCILIYIIYVIFLVLYVFAEHYITNLKDWLNKKATK